MDKNPEILATSETAFNQKSGPRVGDYLLLPYGLYTRFTYIWDDGTLQTGGSPDNAVYISKSGYTSYSGGLDSGVNINDIESTGDIKTGSVWFFNQGVSGAHRGKYFNIDFRVFKLKEGADISGLPQIKRHEKQLIQNQAETITRTDGNGRPYTLPLPELYLPNTEADKLNLEEVERLTGLRFSQQGGWGYACQPLKMIQITSFLQEFKASYTFYNNCDVKNTYKLKLNG